MQVAVLHGTSDLTVDEIPTPLCGRKEVIIKVEADTICRTDLKMYGQRGSAILCFQESWGMRLHALVEQGGTDTYDIYEA